MVPTSSKLDEDHLARRWSNDGILTVASARKFSLNTNCNEGAISRSFGGGVVLNELNCCFGKLLQMSCLQHFIQDESRKCSMETSLSYSRRLLAGQRSEDLSP
ncbi:hypothetical protein E2542_SST19691 [Spatholobus suberectus]|nr:hypothetical protein E2542_SST19691 [Spatholobus suberectus]